MQILRPAACLLAAAALLAGCSRPAERPVRTIDTPLAQAVDIASLVRYRTPHVGNASDVINQGNAVGVQLVGRHTISLQTDAEPYGLTWHVEALAPGVGAERAAAALRPRAVLVLACTDNLGVVTWQVPGLRTDGRLTRAQATVLAGRSLSGQCTPDGLRGILAHLG